MSVKCAQYIYSITGVKAGLHDIVQGMQCAKGISSDVGGSLCTVLCSIHLSSMHMQDPDLLSSGTKS